MSFSFCEHYINDYQIITVDCRSHTHTQSQSHHLFKIRALVDHDVFCESMLQNSNTYRK